MEKWGNGRANEYYEANIPSHVSVIIYLRNMLRHQSVLCDVDILPFIVEYACYYTTTFSHRILYR